MGEKILKMGGDVRVGQRRIAVWMLVQDRALGLTDQEIRRRCQPALAQAALKVAWRYCEAHPDEIARSPSENEEV